MKDIVNRLFNWKQHPASVFWLALPLFLIGFGSMALLAALQWRLHADPVYAVIVAIGSVVLTVALIPAWRMHRMTVRLKQLR